MREIEESGRTAEQAIERALGALGISRGDAEVEVLDPGTRGMFGIGARDARVRVRVRGTPAAVAHQLTERLLRVMGYAATVRVHQHEDTVQVEIRGQNLAPLIGRRGATLDALAVLLGAMVSKQAGSRTRVLADVEGYQERRQATLEGLAQRVAERVVRERREIMLEPMDARERRTIHTALADHPNVMTFSRGEGRARRVVVAPRVRSGGADDRDEPPAGV